MKTETWKQKISFKFLFQQNQNLVKIIKILKTWPNNNCQTTYRQSNTTNFGRSSRHISSHNEGVTLLFWGALYSNWVLLSRTLRLYSHWSGRFSVFGGHSRSLCADILWSVSITVATWKYSCRWRIIYCNNFMFCCGYIWECHHWWIY